MTETKSKIKYTQSDIEAVLEAKKSGLTIRQIVDLTGVNINKVKRICKSSGALLSPEERQAQAFKGKLAKNPNAMADMRKKLTPEVRQKQSVSINATLAANKSKYHEIFSANAKSIWENLRSDSDTYDAFIAKRNKATRQAKLGLTEDEFNVKMDRIKVAVELKQGSVSGMARQEGMDVNTVGREFHKRGWGDLLDGDVSQPEKDLLAWIKSFWPNDDIIENSRTLFNDSTKEIDIFIPSKGFCIEFNGLYWHSSKAPGWYYGKEMAKYKLCLSKKYSLFMIFEDEWADPVKQNILKSMIKHRLGVSDAIKIRASKLSLVKLTKNSDFKPFFEANHLDGHANSSYAYALVDSDNKIISCMSFRTSYDGRLEIARFATDTGYIVYGNASKILSMIKETIITFSDNRFSSGKVYEKMGFTEITKDSGPNYYYTDFKQRIKRQQCMKNNNETHRGYTEAQQAAAGLFSEAIFGKKIPLYRIEGAGTRKWIKEVK